ncbi:choline/ethanolamine kinase [Hesseltinella vesiculosa]|uniref:ethanolamine kinase n=1 Tax=Hesseltinella vesiculosa TaxID=101127 RepID=A0A1X2G3P8_9FUNG|nr:choline/ethanolamine kinase [Hesseltinella vesiculosa]
MPPDTTIATPATDALDTKKETWIDQVINTTRFIDIEVVSTDLFEGAWKVVKAIFPAWNRDQVKFVQCKDGITNQLVRVTELSQQFSVLVRAYGRGSERIIDRRQEIINLITLSQKGLAPPLYARFRNGLVYGFIEGRVSHVNDLGNPKMASWIATRLAQWHKVELPSSSDQPVTRDQQLWKTMRSWLQQVPERYSDPKTQAAFEKHFDMKYITEELEQLIQQLEKLDPQVVFSHNDLLYGNIIFNDDKEEAAFIDYEYGCYGFRGFDIGNHFNEYAGFECDYSQYPSPEFQREWLTGYLTASHDGKTPEVSEVEQLYSEVNGFSLASHYYWGLWALLQAMVSDIDFDYMEYAVLRFNEYERRKEQVLTSLAV